MHTRESALRVLRESLPELRKAYGVRRLALFGSVARDAAREESDVDVLAEFDRPIGFLFVDFAEHLEHILGAKADVLTPDGVAAIHNPEIATRILESAIDV